MLYWELMSTLSIDDVKKLAALSALELRDDEIVPLQKELSEIIGYVEQLQAVDTTGVAPTFQVSRLEDVTRPDELVDYGVDSAALLTPAAKVRDGQLEVPRVVE